MASSLLRSPFATLNNGLKMPTMGFGLGTEWYCATGETAVRMKESLKEALDCGFVLIDSAQMYKNEAVTGQAIAEWLNENSSKKREDLYVVSKVDSDFRAPDKIDERLAQTLKELQVDYLDLLLIHSPFHMTCSIKETWKKMEEFVAKGLVKSIGVSNFGINHLEELLSDSTITPSVNQIECNPNLWNEDLAQFCASKDIRLASYGGLTPMTKVKDETFIKLIDSISAEISANRAQILQGWLHAKGVIVNTTTKQKSRMQDSLDVVNVKLTEAHVDAISKEGSKVFRRFFWNPDFEAVDKEYRRTHGIKE